MPGKYNKEIHRRRSVRLKEYDYAQSGVYFVTICSWQRECLFGDVVDGGMVLSHSGEITHDCLFETMNHFDDVSIDEFVIMPSHVHIIIVMNVQNTQRRGLINQTLTKQPPTNDDDWIMMKNKRQSLGKIIRYFKARSSKLIHDSGINYFRWQRNYYERVIRNKKELLKIRQYILNNPLKWELDEDNPINIS